MDTRTKIIGPDEAQRIAASGATVVTGHFDPVVASHADRLRELKQDGSPLLVAIVTPKNAILPPRARAELVAGLKVVDYVTESAEGLVPQARLEHEDEGRLKNLIAHVHGRQQAAS